MVSLLVRNLSVLLCLLVVQNCLAGFELESNAVEKVRLDLYYESLCPGCSSFIVNNLSTVFENGLIDIIDLKFYPWGNAKLTSDGSVTCQHGPSECLLNEIDACALDVWPTLREHFPFIYCVESLVYEGKYTEWKTCFQKLGLDPKPVIECYSSGQGEKLMLEYGEVTNALEPKKEYVPWVVVDGQPLYEEFEDFISYVCKAYKGTPPSACKATASVGKKKTTNQVQVQVHPMCYTQDPSISTL